MIEHTLQPCHCYAADVHIWKVLVRDVQASLGVWHVLQKNLSEKFTMEESQKLNISPILQ